MSILHKQFKLCTQLHILNQNKRTNPLVKFFNTFELLKIPIYVDSLAWENNSLIFDCLKHFYVYIFLELRYVNLFGKQLSSKLTAICY